MDAVHGELQGLGSGRTLLSCTLWGFLSVRHGSAWRHWVVQVVVRVFKCRSPHLCSCAAVFDGEKRKIEKLMSRRKLKRGCESAAAPGCASLAACQPFLHAL